MTRPPGTFSRKLADNTGRAALAGPTDTTGVKIRSAMPDQEFHEVQLTFKKLFFLFMCAVILAGVIFSFGVSVGRGA
jgi:hypothetical protein